MMLFLLLCYMSSYQHFEIFIHLCKLFKTFHIDYTNVFLTGLKKLFLKIYLFLLNCCCNICMMLPIPKAEYSMQTYIKGDKFGNQI